ncbi:universal stress protein [Massilia scottii]|uniref:universal stress protein n=1 Tax=Massilia scottii TaxID=3057166 RepID=UPI002796816C|nr:universal stress protein [Massilia sp. CCM 9029]MDQ1834258.1 universal stress protein [Massilia sp. CCM 9029]
MKHLLLPFDGSPSATRAARHAAELAVLIPGLRVSLLHVFDPVTLAPHGALVRSKVESCYGAEAAALMAPAVQAFESAGLSVELHCRAGSPASEIALYVHEAGCDALVMGTRGMGAFASILIGSVATRVLQLVSVPVTLVK